jgi:transmembrane sensor
MTSMDSKTRQLETLHAQQASAWLESLRRPNSGAEARFVAWLKESPRNVRDILIMLSLDHALSGIDAERVRNIKTLLAQAHPRLASLPLRGGGGAAGDSGARRRRTFAAFTGLTGPSSRRRLCAVAAGLLIAAIGGWAWLVHARTGWTQFETATGEQRTFELPDGSVVYLNTHSRVAIRFAAHAREVRLLNGEALFRVHHDTSRPFRVSTDDAVVQAVGTQFDVYRREDGTVISVIEGRVNVIPALPSAASAPGTAPQGSAAAPPQKAPSRMLAASQEARVSHAGSVSIREVDNVTDSVAWRERRLIFNEQTLGQIVGEFNRYRSNPIRLEGTEVSARTYTGVFDADDADSLVEVLARDPALSVDRSPAGTVVRLK